LSIASSEAGTTGTIRGAGSGVFLEYVWAAVWRAADLGYF